jgi:hypothetical protein
VSVCPHCGRRRRRSPGHRGLVCKESRKETNVDLKPAMNE